MSTDSDGGNKSKMNAASTKWIVVGVVAIVFMITSLLLAVMSVRQSSISGSSIRWSFDDTFADSICLAAVSISASSKTRSRKPENY